MATGVLPSINASNSDSPRPSCAGVFTRDVAETKSTQVMDYARENGMPLLLTTEAE